MAKDNKQSREDDKEFQILLNAINRIDLVATFERARAKTTERLISSAIENAEADKRKIDPAEVQERIHKLFHAQEERSLALLRVIKEQGEDKAIKMLEDMERLRVFFFAISYGWEQARRAYGRWNVDKLMQNIRRSCSEEVAAYKLAWREWREARRRFLATESEREWQWYKAGKGNKNSVAYRTKVDLARNAESHFRNRRLMKYMGHELLSRQGERRRARKELRAAQTAMTLARNLIYERKGISLDLV